MPSGSDGDIEHFSRPGTEAIGANDGENTGAVLKDPALAVELKDLRKEYRSGQQPLVLFDGLNLTVRTGEMVAIVGESGSGKSTLLHLLAALDRPSAGDVYCASTWLGKLTAGQAATFRNREIGYVWQLHYLLPEFTALENAAMPLLARNEPKQTAFDKARQLLCEVGLEARTHHLAGELSGGEQQRVSLARALVTEPALLLADEPTGNLDNRTAETVFGLLARLHTSHRLTSILVTHNMEIASRCGRVLRLHKGRLQEIQLREASMDETDAGTAWLPPMQNPGNATEHLNGCTALAGETTSETA
ncbi:MAG TPA: ABC transporter ATP-binding protein [Acidobacteriaceae bacterium]|nr:ABC transporter ATP-binding protein [Acidobacteriaceae bacterium]